MTPTLSQHSYSVSCPFHVRDAEKFLSWATSLGINAYRVMKVPLGRFVITPPVGAAWESIDIPEDAELSQDNGFWAWFAEDLSKHLAPGQVVTLYGVQSAANSEGLPTWVDGFLHIIGSHGGYAYGDFSDLVHHILLGEEWPLGQVSIHTPGTMGVHDGFVTLPEPEPPKTMKPQHQILVLRRSDLELDARDTRFESVGPEHIAKTRDVFDNADTVMFLDGVRSRLLKGTRSPCKASSFSDGFRGASQMVIDGLLVSTFPDDEHLGVRAGTLICQPWTDEDGLACAPDEDVLWATVSRQDESGEWVLFRDSGAYIPE